jgi:hypothetical protein
MRWDIERGSDEWNRVWAALDAALKSSPLPVEGGGTVHCDVCDFMLMGVNDDGTAHFKNVITRHYLNIAEDGSMRIPTGKLWTSGVFAHEAVDEQRSSCKR